MAGVLVVVDYENEWVTKDSEYCVGDISEKIEKLNRLIGFCRGKGIPIIFTTHIEPGSEEAFAEGTERVEIMRGVDFRAGEDTLIKKNRISPFFGTGLESRLKELDADELIITGILTNLCVRSCVSDAYDRDFGIKVITDTCVSLSDDVQEFTLRDLKDTRPEIGLLTADEFIKK